MGSRRSISTDRKEYLETINMAGLPIHTLMARTGSFPLRVACQLLGQFRHRQSSVIFDPFSGKGTSLLAARMLGYDAYGMDIAPEAVVCSRAKLLHVSPAGVVDYIVNLRTNGPPIESVPAHVRVFFAPSTLSQLLSVREQLLHDMTSRNPTRQVNAQFVMAVLLGILHGHASYSLSVSSSHAFSMSPAYVKRFAVTHGLRRPARDIKKCLVEKINRCLRCELPTVKRFEVKQGSVLHCRSIFPELIGKVDTILTSPPYLNAQTYAKDNWLRLWFLGYDYKQLRPDYIETGSVTRYEEHMLSAFKEMAVMLKPGGRLICVAGDIRRRNSTGLSVFRTGSVLADVCESAEIGLRVEQRERHVVRSTHRYFHALSNSNGHHKRDLVERIFVARKE